MLDPLDAIVEFLQARKRFVMELTFWLGVVLIVGFIRVNFFQAEVAINMPEYQTYSILGVLTNRETDVEKGVEMNVGKKRRE